MDGKPTPAPQLNGRRVSPQKLAMIDYSARRRAMDRERKRLVAERQQRMSGERKLQHIYNAIRSRAELARKGSK